MDEQTEAKMRLSFDAMRTLFPVYAEAFQHVMFFIWEEFPPDVPVDACAWARAIGAESTAPYEDHFEMVQKWTFKDGSYAVLGANGGSVMELGRRTH